MSGRPRRDAAWSGKELRAWLDASCHRQGVPVIIHDPSVIAQVVTLLGISVEGRARRMSGRRPTTAPKSVPADKPETPGVVDPGSLGGRIPIDRRSETRAA